MAFAPKVLTGRLFGAALAAGGAERGWALALRARFAAALDEEWALRRPFLWLPVAAGAGAILSLSAEREPSLIATLLALAIFSAIAFLVREKRAAFALAAGLAALSAGFASQGFRTARVAAPALDRDLVGVDDLADRQIRAHGVPDVADLVGLVGLEPMQRIAILVGIDRHRADAHLVGGAEGADRDLTAVCDQNFGDHSRTLPPENERRC